MSWTTINANTTCLLLENEPDIVRSKFLGKTTQIAICRLCSVSLTPKGVFGNPSNPLSLEFSSETPSNLIYAQELSNNIIRTQQLPLELIEMIKFLAPARDPHSAGMRKPAPERRVFIDDTTTPPQILVPKLVGPQGTYVKWISGKTHTRVTVSGQGTDHAMRNPDRQGAALPLHFHIVARASHGRGDPQEVEEALDLAERHCRDLILALDTEKKMRGVDAQRAAKLQFQQQLVAWWSTQSPEELEAAKLQVATQFLDGESELAMNFQVDAVAPASKRVRK
eukprot:gnl/Dysnectes_brevis/2493_a2981_1390.p1 GENE.gnl/Dysnectes_brevis/2493_a2981_1390~~gnl/Dysnectes_brevis/2493_a2981_1390.p1  ORF type:complete len:281 (-),score=39.09 gnl/Dysnectes_brevis/2493_a2981_1390:19-861(-)